MPCARRTGNNSHNSKPPREQVNYMTRTGIDWAYEVIDRYDGNVYLEQFEEDKLEEAFEILDKAGELEKAGKVWDRADETKRANWLLNLQSSYGVHLPPEIRNEKWTDFDSQTRYRLSRLYEDYEQ